MSQHNKNEKDALGNQAGALLEELAIHFAYDAIVNPIKDQDGNGMGRIIIVKSEGSLWKRIIDMIGYEPDPNNLQPNIIKAFLKK